MDSDALENAFVRVKEKYDISLTLKHEQWDAVSCVLHNRDCLVFLPTGFGKSWCYILPPLMYHEVSSKV